MRSHLDAASARSAALADIGSSSSTSGSVYSTGVADQIATVGTLVPLVSAVTVRAGCHFLFII